MASEANDRAFFVVGKGELGSVHDTEYLPAEGANFGDAPTCSVCREFVEGKPWLPPYRADLRLHGSRWGDFAFFGESEFLVSDRVFGLYTKAGLTGLTGFEPVESVSIEGAMTPPPRYRHVSIARSGAAVDESRSSLTRPAPVTCDSCRVGGVEAIDGFSLELGTWTGEDVFVARGLAGVVLATLRFRKLVDDHGLTNVRLIPINSYKWDALAPIQTYLD